MFIYLPCKDSQKKYKNATFSDFSSFRHKASLIYRDVLSELVGEHKQELTYGIVPHTAPSILSTENLSSVTVNANIAINTPNAQLGEGDSVNNFSDVLIGSFGNYGSLNLHHNADKTCTQSEVNALKLCNLFQTFAGKCFEKIEKQFDLFGWHNDQQQLHIAKDPLNPRSIYWVELDYGVLISTNLQFINEILQQPFHLSETGLASWLSGYPNPAISLFKNINVLPIGYRLQVSTTLQTSLVKFWDIEPEHKIHYPKQQFYTEHFLQGLSKSVANTCDTNANVVVSQMSGGMDSTSVTVLANKHLTNLGKTVLPLSHLYKQSEKCDEEQLMDEMLSSLNIKHSIKMIVDEEEDRDFLKLYPTDLESPGTVLSPRYIRELALVQQAGANVLLTGNGGDEMCWGHSTAYTQRLKKGDFGVVGEVLNACPALEMPTLKTLSNLFIKPFLPEMILNALAGREKHADDFNTPLWLTSKAKELAYQETLISNPFDIKKDPVGYNRYLSLKTTSTYNAMRSYDKLAERFGISVKHPFFDTAVAEFSFAVPPKQLIQGPYPKWLLRHSMQNELPDNVCWNLKKTTFDQHFGNLVRENASQLRDVLQDERLSDMGLVNQSLLLAEFDRVVANKNIPLQVDLLYAILTYTWLQTHFPE